MAADRISLPAGGGGLMRYSEEYKSRFMLDPSHVILFILFIIIFVMGLKLLFPL